MKVKATYVSVWDGGVELSSNCLFDTETKVVSDIDEVYDVDVDVLEEERLELVDGTIIPRESFILEDEVEI
ncbi:hypothetical protein E6Q11_05090 [Candidatus Dojkabacteria bacterium]|uniref:Uncharacterized protein n=1 Tax=Candidatus Dojkabacteria bacterium TaxID=2099670 RepID=A0A5C7J3V3_9BACT|nr:MAG: hypothetical protein E6Q11_05090 [Candidatus Dojkabacteria bacterium]